MLEHTPHSAESVRPTDRFVDDLEYDSLMVVELLLAIEQELGLAPIELADVQDIATFAELESFVEARMSGREVST